MDYVEKACELAKAKVLELDSAILEFICLKTNTYEELKAAVLRAAADGRNLCAELRARVDANDFRRN